MRARIIGRLVGSGGRVAGRIAGQSVLGGGAPGRRSGLTGRNLVRGLGGVLAPIRRVGGIVWHEVMGVIFLLPALLGASSLWRTRASWRFGPDHRSFLSGAVLFVVFLYLSLSSFWRAGKR